MVSVISEVSVISVAVTFETKDILEGCTVMVLNCFSTSLLAGSINAQ